MKIIALIGVQPNHRFLCERLNKEFGLDSVVIVSKRNNAKHSIMYRIVNKLVSYPLSAAWKNMQLTFEQQLEGLPSEKIFNVEDINSLEVLSLVEKLKPDLVIVSGTNLLKKTLIGKATESGKIMNLHTGISPYVKGGPNCTNWCLSNKDFHMIGNTIMWIDEGIDTGNLVFTEKTKIDGSEGLAELHKKVMNHAHEMYLKCVELYIRREELPNIRQCDIAEGMTFYTKQWGVLSTITALKNYYFYFNSKAINNKNCELKLVDIMQINIKANRK